jgi:hypothetical protein
MPDPMARPGLEEPENSSRQGPREPSPRQAGPGGPLGQARASGAPAYLKLAPEPPDGVALRARATTCGRASAEGPQPPRGDPA